MKIPGNATYGQIFTAVLSTAAPAIQVAIARDGVSLKTTTTMARPPVEPADRADLVVLGYDCFGTALLVTLADWNALTKAQRTTVACIFLADGAATHDMWWSWVPGLPFMTWGFRRIGVAPYRAKRCMR